MTMWGTALLAVWCFCLVFFASIQAEEFFESINAIPPRPAFPFESRDRRATCQEADQILDEYQLNLMTNLHNDYRKKPLAANMRKVTWDYNIAKRAQAKANTCTFHHSLLHDCDGKRMGQNLYVAYNSYAEYPKLDLAKAIEGWFNEGEDYNIETLKCTHVCGHYKQVVWADTTKVGCGYKLCDSVQMDDGYKVEKALLVACNYLRYAGNYAPYIRGKQCSNCGSGYKCEDKLCVPSSG